MYMAEENIQNIQDIAQMKQALQALEDLIRNHSHQGYDLTPKLLNTSLNQATIINNSTIGDGLNNPASLELKVAPDKGDTEIRAGIDTGDFANAAAKAGFIIGIDDSDSDTVKFFFGNSSTYIKWTGSTLSVVGDITGSTGTFSGTVTVASIDIGGSDSTSCHIDTDGNFWTGSGTLGGAPATILKSGSATFKDITLGGAVRQYTISDTGIGTFGDGSDGALSTSGNVTLTSDKYYTNLTINDGHTFNPAGYRIFCLGTLTVGNGTSGILARNGNNGSGTTGGAALADGYLKGSAVGGKGATSGVDDCGVGANTSNSLGSNGSRGGKGGGGSTSCAGGTATASNVKLIANWHLQTLLDISATGATLKFDNSAGSGGGKPGDGAGNGGGAGSAGGIVAIYAKNIVINSGAIISANGGNGADGNGGSNYGGGGGGGGNGGEVILVYNTLTNNGSITASAGTGGSGGSGSIAVGETGVNGTAGHVRQFQISL